MTCEACNGTGLEDPETLCPVCEGSGGKSNADIPDRDPDPEMPSAVEVGPSTSGYAQTFTYTPSSEFEGAQP